MRLDGETLGPKLPGTVGERFEPLFSQLKAGRELWKQLHPGADFAATASIVVDPDVEAGPGAAIVRTTALAGYAAFALRSGPVALSFEWKLGPSLPRPREPLNPVEWGPPPLQDEVLRVGAKPGALVEIRFDGSVTPRLGLRRTIPISRVGELFASECSRTPGASVSQAYQGPQGT